MVASLITRHFAGHEGDLNRGRCFDHLEEKTVEDDLPAVVPEIDDTLRPGDPRPEDLHVLGIHAHAGDRLKEIGLRTAGHIHHRVERVPGGGESHGQRKGVRALEYTGSRSLE